MWYFYLFLLYTLILLTYHTPNIPNTSDYLIWRIKVSLRNSWYILLSLFRYFVSHKIFRWNQLTKYMIKKGLSFLYNFAQQYPDRHYEIKFFIGKFEIFQDLIQEWAAATANKIYKYLTKIPTVLLYTESDYQIVNLITNILLILFQIFFITTGLSLFLLIYSVFRNLF